MKLHQPDFALSVARWNGRARRCKLIETNINTTSEKIPHDRAHLRAVLAGFDSSYISEFIGGYKCNLCANWIRASKGTQRVERKWHL